MIAVRAMACTIAGLALAGASDAWASSTQGSGGAGLTVSAAPRATPSRPMVAGSKARIIHGLAYAPENAPLIVQEAIWAGDKIYKKPYRALHYASLARLWPAYDCSGSVSYVLYKAGLISSAPEVSGDFESFGLRGRGRWITVYGSAGHAFMEVAGIVFDTAHYAPTTPAGTGPRWQPASIIPEQLQDGNVWSIRHPIGY
jgi:hypothetical protein